MIRIILKNSLYLYHCLISILISLANTDVVVAEDYVITRDQFLLTRHGSLDFQPFVSRDDSSTYKNFDCVVTSTETRGRGVLIADAESYACGLSYERSLSKTLRLSVNLKLSHTSGGIFDNSIERFHSIFSLPNGSRDHFDENLQQFRGITNKGEKFTIKEDNFQIADPQFFLSNLLYSGELGQSSIETVISIPVGYGLYAPILGLGYVHGISFDRFKINSGIRYSFITNSTLRGSSSDDVKYKTSNLQSFVSLEVPFNNSLTGIAALNAYTLPVSGIERVPGYGGYLDLGLRTSKLLGHFSEFIIRENPYPNDYTADVSFLFRIVY